jgi:hypothetical protein
MGRNLDYPMPLEGRMARQQLARIAMDATKLHNALRDDDDLPAWVLLKINTAEDRLHMAADYLRYKVAPGLDAYNGFGSAHRAYGASEQEERKKLDTTLKLLGVVAAGYALTVVYGKATDKLAARRRRA